MGRGIHGDPSLRSALAPSTWASSLSASLEGGFEGDDRLMRGMQCLFERLNASQRHLELQPIAGHDVR